MSFLQEPRRARFAYFLVSMHLDVFLTPCTLSDEALEGRIAVVIDVLRATTTIASALSAGARAVQPAADRQTVEALRAQANDESYLRAGERDGVKIGGYDLGNSPLDYTAEAVAGKTVILTTTNGTFPSVYSRIPFRWFRRMPTVRLRCRRRIQRMNTLLP